VSATDHLSNGHYLRPEGETEEFPRSMEVFKPLVTAHTLLIEAMAAAIFRSIHPEEHRMYGLLSSEISKLASLTRVACADALSILEEESA
jgi:hypothetical protein